MSTTNVAEAKAKLSKLIEDALDGEEVVISKHGKPLVKLVPVDVDTSPRDLSVRTIEGDLWMAPDFDDLPEEVLRQFDGESDEAIA